MIEIERVRRDGPLRSDRRSLLAGSAAAIGLGLVLLVPCHAQTNAPRRRRPSWPTNTDS